MIKLITQFDNEKTKLSLATPTCGCCCCCCCCCVVSTFAAASISARNFGNYVEEQLPNEPKKIKRARRFGFWFPLGLLTSLGIGLWLAEAFELNAIIALIVIGIAYLFIVTSSLKKRLNLPGITSRVIGFSILLGIFEVVGFFVGMFALVYLGWFYLAGAIIITILLISWAFGKTYDGLEDKNNISNNNSNNISNNQSDDNKNDIKKIDHTNSLTNDFENKEINSNAPKEKKKCPNCGTENAIDNKRCIYCSNFFEKDDEK